MRDAKSNGLQMSWVQVRDESGRTHLEARWSAPVAEPAVAPVVPVTAPAPHAA